MSLRYLLGPVPADWARRWQTERRQKGDGPDGPHFFGCSWGVLAVAG